MTVEQWLGADNQMGIDIWHNKYQFQDETFEEWLDRISNGNQKLRNLILKKEFLPAGRILSNRKLHESGLKITYSNCYVVTSPEDSIESIFECATKLARTLSYGGGVGVDISKLAPRNATIKNAAKKTSGAVSFTDLYSFVTGLIGQDGRRGALMLSLSCDHPDLEEFIQVKSDLNRLTKSNISIRITNEFLKAVKNNKNHIMKFVRSETKEEIIKEVNAKDLFRKIAEMNWDYGEPGFLFWDRIEDWNLLNNNPDFKFESTNPCA